MMILDLLGINLHKYLINKFIQINVMFGVQGPFIMKSFLETCQEIAIMKMKEQKKY